MADDLILSDMGQCTPASGLSETWCDGKWMLLDYQTEEGVSGRMLYYTFYPLFHAAMRRPPGEDFVAPPHVTLPVGVSGRFEVYLGMHYASNARLEGPQIQIRLSEEEGFSTVGREQCQPKDGDFPDKSGFGIFDVAEVFWCTADMDGQDIVIAPPGSYYGTDQFFTNLVYVRLVAVDELRPVRYASSSPGEDTRRLVAYYGGPPRSIELARDWVDCFRDSDFALLLWGTGGDADPDVARLAIERAHELDLQIYASLRFSGLKMDNYLPIHEIYAEHSLGSSILTDHPEWRKRSPEGLMSNSMSLVFEEVQDFWLAEISRVLAWGFDGVNIVMARCFPFVLFEEPATSTFLEQYGEDPRLLPPDDDRWVRHRAAIVTGFIRKVRPAADEIGRRQSRRLGTAYHTMNSLANSLFFTIDAQRWIRESLIDHCIVHPCHSAAPGMPDPGGVEPDLLAGFVEAAAGTECRIYADVYPRRMPTEACRQKALALYATGIDGLSLWDTQARRTRSSEWSLIRKLGHRRDLSEWIDDTRGLFRRTTLRTLQGITTDRAYSFTDG